jgi:SAM-dependent methyltransferase
MSKYSVSEFYQSDYQTKGFGAQRLFPNEELCRFMGRHYFPKSLENRKSINVLDVGCGSGSNLWMIAREGFNAYGLDLSAEATKLCAQMLDKYECSAQLHVASMTDLPYDDNSMDVIVDVFSSNCLSAQLGQAFLQEVYRVLKPNGRFFSYFPSKNSHAWSKADPNDIIDKDTLRGITRLDSPFYGNNYPFRFLLPDEYEARLADIGMQTRYKETVSRTYRNGLEYFEFVVIEGVNANSND